MESLELGASGHSSTMLRTRLAGGRKRHTACKIVILLKREDAATRPAKYLKSFRRLGSTRKEFSSANQLFVSISPKRRTSGSVMLFFCPESWLDMTEMERDWYSWRLGGLWLPIDRRRFKSQSIINSNSHVL